MLPSVAWLARTSGYACIPLFVGGRIAIGALIQGSPPYHPDATAQAIFAAVFSLAVAYWMFRRLSSSSRG
jgi:hypothetical protein